MMNQDRIKILANNDYMKEESDVNGVWNAYVLSHSDQT